jgi:putative ABC transport system ATP-binding protein
MASPSQSVRSVSKGDGATASALLRADGICRLLEGAPFLHDLNLEIPGGERIALVGATGSGKTILLRALSRLDPLDGGRILWHGREVQRDEIPRFRSRVIYLHQRPVLCEGTVEDNLRQPFSLRVHHDRTFDREMIESRLGALGRDVTFLQKRHHELSGGESQIVALLRAIQLDPEVLLLDEPTTALDADSVRAIEDLVESWFVEHRSNRAVAWVTHDRTQAVRIAARILTMNRGSLVDGSVT